jgi:mannose-6-phosphate isomerase-like protein (cupin superfamily)
VAPRFAVRRLADVPRVPTDAADPDWYPLQHHFGMSAFGANVYVARAAGVELLAEHDELASNQEELYLVTSGEAAFVIDGEHFDAPAVSVVAVPDPAVRRAATANIAGTTIVAIGGERQPEFRTSWQKQHFENVPTL